MKTKTSMEIVVKRFGELTVDELYEILRLRAEVFVVEQDSVYQDLDGRDQDSIHVFAKEGDEIVSYLRVIKPGTGRPYVSIGRVLTKKEARGRGLARALMDEGIEVARELSPIIEIKAQAYLRDFYERLGFKPYTDVYEYEGRPHISMRLEFHS